MCDMSVSAYARSKINLLSLAEQQARDTFKVLRFFSWLPLTASQVTEEGQTSSSLLLFTPPKLWYVVLYINRSLQLWLSTSFFRTSAVKMWT